MSAEVFHRLGVALGVVLALAWVMRWAVGVRRERQVRRRLAALLDREADAKPPRFEAAGVVRRWWPTVAVVGAGWVLVGGVLGVVVGVIAAAGVWRWRQRQTAAVAEGDAFDPREAARQLPLAADLVAACITAGAGPVIAAQAVGEALGGPVGAALARGAAEVRLGGEPAEAWRGLAATPGADALARLLERADVSGLPAAAPVARIAADARADWARSATARARRAAVLVTAPVGLCFLPAFIAVGVLPVVIGLAGGVLGGGGG
ncbi:type II secretion system F family protein [Streptomyces sp. TRM70350]|uniref:type II secretion system F family protein n=1 Tax=Streptomyces sp. TRM70350 TaxID=2856165 RepID=UPI001C46519B|nr:type II secretion system F family protein [Streptomyces sp. TRM70350]MBV7696027.1 type II secretion system F family protein [Streptomyces sp. TRM70350]